MEGIRLEELLPDSLQQLGLRSETADTMSADDLVREDSIPRRED